MLLLFLCYIFFIEWHRHENISSTKISFKEKICFVQYGRIKKGYPYEARVITRLLPAFLADFFPPQDIMNKVIGEFLSSQQPYPHLIAKVVFQVIWQLYLSCVNACDFRVYSTCWCIGQQKKSFWAILWLAWFVIYGVYECLTVYIRWILILISTFHYNWCLL